MSVCITLYSWLFFFFFPSVELLTCENVGLLSDWLGTLPYIPFFIHIHTFYAYSRGADAQ